MTKAALEALKNSLLASATPITAASHHRPMVQHIINELYDFQSRADIMAALTEVLSLSSGDKVLIFRAGVAKVVDKSLLTSVNGGTA